MDRYVELFGPLKFIIIYSSLYVIGMLSLTYVVFGLLLQRYLSSRLGIGLGFLYLFIGLWLSRKHVLLTKE